MSKLVVLYKDRRNAETFDKHYSQVHIQMVALSLICSTRKTLPTDRRPRRLADKVFG
jgi:hypothetical protein